MATVRSVRVRTDWLGLIRPQQSTQHTHPRNVLIGGCVTGSLVSARGGDRMRWHVMIMALVVVLIDS